MSVRKAEKGFAFLMTSRLDEIVGGSGEMPSGGGIQTEDSCDAVAAAVDSRRALCIRICPDCRAVRGCPAFRRDKLPLITVRMVLRRHWCTSAMVLRKWNRKTQDGDGVILSVRTGVTPNLGIVHTVGYLCLSRKRLMYRRPADLGPEHGDERACRDSIEELHRISVTKRNCRLLSR